MQSKLTLRLDADVIRRIKRYSKRSGKSLSRLVEDYFALLGARSDASEPDLTPRVRSLLGALSATRVSEEDYHRHLEERHG
jgi:hypothetical protein